MMSTVARRTGGRVSSQGRRANGFTRDGSCLATGVNRVRRGGQDVRPA
jgi:hypothetical protein